MADKERERERGEDVAGNEGFDKKAQQTANCLTVPHKKKEASRKPSAVKTIIKRNYISI